MNLLTFEHEERVGLGYEKQSHRVVFIEYRGRRPIPCNVITEHDWDHSKRSWFKAGERERGVAQDNWDFDYSKRHGGLYYHNSGGGGGPVTHVELCGFINPKTPQARIWIAPGIKLKKWVRKDTYKEIDAAGALKLGYQIVKRPLSLNHLLSDYDRKEGKKTCNPFEAGEESENGLIYCKECDDWMIDDEYDLCEHLEYCSKCGSIVYSKDGMFIDQGSSRCQHVNREEDDES
jgi:hypothetical protein